MANVSGYLRAYCLAAFAELGCVVFWLESSTVIGSGVVVRELKSYFCRLGRAVLAYRVRGIPAQLTGPLSQKFHFCLISLTVGKEN